MIGVVSELIKGGDERMKVNEFIVLEQFIVSRYTMAVLPYVFKQRCVCESH